MVEEAGAATAVIGVDIGGTNTKMALVAAESHEVMAKRYVPTRAELGVAAVVDHLARQIRGLMATASQGGRRVQALGIGAAGLIDLRAGVVLNSPNLPGWRQVGLRTMLQERFQVPVVLENDVNCIGYGEYYWGAAKGLDSFVLMALGTGVGGCVFIDGRAWTGAHTSAGEIGHITIEPDGEHCGCGNRGCLETLASAGWLVRRARNRLQAEAGAASVLQTLMTEGRLAADSICAAAAAGDRLARELVDKVGWSLAIAIANVVHLLGIRHVIIGGGLARAWEQFVSPLQAELRRRLSLVPPGEVSVVPAALGDDAGSLGAAAIAIAGAPSA